jgi:aryl-alcohol dehydrogenase-like predicted oxidoreductase
MKTDYLDAVQFHGSPPEADEDAAIATLVDLKKEGKVRYIGASATLPRISHLIETGVMDVFQIPYSALQREHESAISDAAKAGAGTIIRGGVARGAPSDDRDWSQRLPDSGNLPLEDVWAKAGLDDLLDGKSRMEFILRFTLTHPDLHTTIVGTGKPEHLQANLEAAKRGPLPADVYTEAKRRLDAAVA